MNNRIFYGIAALLGVSLTVLATDALASDFIVPDNYSTIAQAIVSGADTVSVRPGSYPESLVISRKLVLRGVCSAGAWGTDCPLTDRPVVASVSATSSAPGVQLLNLHVTGSAHLARDGFLVRGSQFDAGLSGGAGGQCNVDSCQVFGDLHLINGFGSHVSNNTVTGGTISAGSQGSMSVNDNVVLGPAPVGIVGGEDCNIANNHVSGCVDGIQAGSINYISGNFVEDCSGNGYTDPYQSSSGQAVFIQDTARRCAGRGFYVKYFERIENCLVDSTGLEGIYAQQQSYAGVLGCTVLRAGGTGIYADFNPGGKLRGNLVLGSGGDGISVGWCDVIDSNVVGRSHGAGIVSRGIPDVGYRVHNNTAYLNGGAGIDLVGGMSTEVDSVYNNISTGNAVGLRWSIDPNLPPRFSPAVALLGCNDWFDNVTARVVGTDPAVSDTSIAPFFCDLVHDVVSLASTSPLVNLPGCGLVGALGVGCTLVASVGPGVAAPPLRLRVSPQPGHGPLQFSFRRGAGPTRLEIYDVSGARRWSATVPREQESVRWSGRGDDGQALRAGVYFARVTQDGAHSEARVVILR